MTTARGRLLVANKQNTINQLNVAIARMEDTTVKVYRDIVGQIFRRILLQTPQFNGVAVVHWTIGINGPSSFQFDPTLGRQDEKRYASLSGSLKPLERGNRYWINVAWNREKPKIDALQRRDKVYITNVAQGDTDNGQSSALYMESLQNPAYWAKKLRDVNRPYEITYDSVAHVMGRWWAKGVDPFKVYVPQSGDVL